MADSFGKVDGACAHDRPGVANSEPLGVHRGRSLKQRCTSECRPLKINLFSSALLYYFFFPFPTHRKVS